MCEFSRKKIVGNTEKNTKLHFNYGYDFVQQREKKSKKWHFTGKPGWESRAAVFLVPREALHKWESEFAQL